MLQNTTYAKQAAPLFILSQIHILFISYSTQIVIVALTLKQQSTFYLSVLDSMYRDWKTKLIPIFFPKAAFTL